MVETAVKEFQSTLPREERQKKYAFCNPLINFNPRSHERSDKSPTTSCLLWNISIHAPTRGATLSCLTCRSGSAFQSTLPREERRRKRFLRADKANFNPRSHERSDGKEASKHHNYRDFNPRSHERSDAVTVCTCTTCLNFNPRSHERSDLGI